MTAVDIALARLSAIRVASHAGAVLRVNAGAIVADGPNACVGDLCTVSIGTNGRALIAEVVAIDRETITLVPLERSEAVRPGARVTLDRSNQSAPVGDGFGGRAIDAMGAPFDGLGPIVASDYARLSGRVLSPLERAETGPLLASGFASMDVLAPLSKGQRIGVFAASGVGKTTLVRRLAETVACDRCIICLVGERGKEVEQTWRQLSSRADADRFTLVAATSDQSATKRVRSVWQALCLAEFWRDQGEHVLFVVDSATRLALALREIGLSAGEPPTARAFTPNVFSALPLMVERCGSSRSGGAITGVFSVLCETDDVDDPIAETMKSLLDGHIILSRRLAAQGQWPALDPLRSISRQAEHVMEADVLQRARRVTELLARYDEGQVMVESGVYRAGADPVLDQAIKSRPAIMSFLAKGAGAPLSSQKVKDALMTLDLGNHFLLERQS
ncbi:FliI/YscN family ATPase [Aquidulcibacter sp.]|jgi:flagellum-specific ATP synthase|uniref:FliI/YscN family ATPase n=1 Tax=Aquidulcibacter sp. TaxID=2052990 RepID=UPI0037C0297A